MQFAFYFYGEVLSGPIDIPRAIRHAGRSTCILECIKFVFIPGNHESRHVGEVLCVWPQQVLLIHGHFNTPIVDAD